MRVGMAMTDKEDGGIGKERLACITPLTTKKNGKILVVWWSEVERMRVKSAPPLGNLFYQR